MKNKSIVPVSYLLEAIQLQKKKKRKKVEIDNDKSLNAIKKNDDNMELKCKQIYAKVLKEKNKVMSILF